MAETQKNAQLTGVLEGFLASADKRGVVVDGVTGRNRPNQEILLYDWLITSHVT